MDKDKFIKYCVEVMGGYYANYNGIDSVKINNLWMLAIEYNPYDDLNQMVVVVEKLLDDADKFYLAKFSSHTLDTVGIKQAFRDFIISTMPEDSEK